MVLETVITTQGWAELGLATLGLLGSMCGTHTEKKESRIQGHQELFFLEFKVIGCIVKTLTPLFIRHWKVQVFKQFAFSWNSATLLCRIFLALETKG